MLRITAFQVHIPEGTLKDGPSGVTIMFSSFLCFYDLAKKEGWKMSLYLNLKCYTEGKESTGGWNQGESARSIQAGIRKIYPCFDNKRDTEYRYQSAKSLILCSSGRIEDTFKRLYLRMRPGKKQDKAE